MVCGLGPHRTPNEGPRYSQMLQTHMRVLFSSMLSMIFTDFMIFIILYHIWFFHVLPYSSLKTSTKQGTWSQFMDPYSHPPHHRPHLFHSDKNHRHAASLQGTRLATIKSPRHKWIQMDISTILRDMCPMKSTQQIFPKMGKTLKMEGTPKSSYTRLFEYWKPWFWTPISGTPNLFLFVHVGVSINGATPKWMVSKGNSH